MNKVMLVGRLTRDPELKFTATSGKQVSKFTLAVDRGFSTKEESRADFLPVVAWGKLAEFCYNYLKKGRKVIVAGKIHARSWDDANGVRHYATEIFAQEIHFADSKKGTSFGEMPITDGEEAFTAVS